ncbi:MAG: hypothetical protein L0332_24015 [Chloroflexi bacterium]|nr:hypothetical protein [Chloroflexota bacterium]MCI0650061.1 hypothetical protein [Chloroflexota bacterium]MCI0729760.1 hypothetical protein [Chloroflexota bacterium]
MTRKHCFTYLFNKRLLLVWLALLVVCFGRPARAMNMYSVNNPLDEPDANPGDENCISAPSGVCTLRAAVMEANFEPDQDTIILQPGEIYLLTRPGVNDDGGDLDIHSDLIIQVAGGGRATIDGNGGVTQDRVIETDPATLTISITGVTIQNGKSLFPGGGLGGGIANRADLTLNSVTVRNNSADVSGGGIWNTGTLTIIKSTVNANSASDEADGGEGGGVVHASSGSLTVINSTISGNTTAGSGGGLYVPLGTAYLANTTIAFNFAGVSSGGAGGGIAVTSPGVVTMMNSIVAGNERGLIFPIDDDCSGTILSNGYNLVETTAGCVFTGTTTGNLLGVSPLLYLLADNGGLTQTHALQPGSPAIDMGNPGSCRDFVGFALSTDQRGIDRHLDSGSGSARCDMGAFEYVPGAGPATFIYLPVVRG